MSSFNNIVVGFHYTHPYYSTIPFLHELYGFPLVAVYGPTPGEDVIVADTQGGHVGYRIFLDMFERFPSADGYLLVHDDFLLNRWNLEKLDLRKVWTQPRINDPITDWNWWGSWNARLDGMKSPSIIADVADECKRFAVR